MNIINYYPKKWKDFLAASGKDFIETIGENAVKEALLSVLSGANLRDSTEFITRRKLALSNGAILVMFLRGCSSRQDFLEKLNDKVIKGLKGRNSKYDRWILEWLLGLTDKAVQNILRDDPKELNRYKSNFDKAIKESLYSLQNDFGEIRGKIICDEGEVKIDWALLIRIFQAIGAQTLTIRGSEKSMYGKVFEKLLLGTLLEMLGFRFIDRRKPPRRIEKCFWLSEREERRESDATLIYKPGKGVRLDIGFIGRGNPEISLDKVSRFEREIELGNKTHYMNTYIIIDRIGRRSRVEALAKEIKADIIQMSLSLWPKNVATLLKRDFGYRHSIIKMDEDKTHKFLRNEIKKISIKKFIER